MQLSAKVFLHFTELCFNILLALASDQNGPCIFILCKSDLKIKCLLTWPKSNTDIHSALSQTTVLLLTTASRHLAF